MHNRSIQPVALASVATALAFASLGAQQPAAGEAATLAPYRAPVIALVQPPADDSVPSDKPFVVLRFVAGEPDDPIDVRSFAITVDGEDRTAQFHVTPTHAWGPLLDAHAGHRSGTSTGQPLKVTARICSIRGACGRVTASVPLASPTVASADLDSRRDRFLDLLLRLVRRLLVH